MKPVLDKFSAQANFYAKFRPHYPDELFEYLFSLAKSTDAAWDCGTGNGQVAAKLASRFKQVYATDISQAQLSHAEQKENISYILTRAEHTSFPDNTFDLITVAQAIHWFDFDAFYNEIRRVAKPSALLAVWGYGLTTISPEIDALIYDFYTNIVGKYWDAERKHIDQAYRTVPFPFRALQTPPFKITEQWSCEQFIGYLNSWSAVQNFINSHHQSPLDSIASKLQMLWNNDEVKEVNFPLFMRTGMVEK
jgi:SAM-dependent methyltransferase